MGECLRPLHTLQELLHLLALESPLRPWKAEDVPNALIRDVAQAPDGSELGDVDYASFVQNIIADVDGLNVPKDEGRGVLPGSGMYDVVGLVELQGKGIQVHGEREVCKE